MTRLLAYLGMDVTAMTMNDWTGVFLALVAVIGMVATYVLVFRPSNKEQFEAQGRMILDDDDPVKLGDKR